jgi:hypothetical protein
MTQLLLDGKKVLAGTVTFSGKRNLDAKPNQNADGPVEAQTNSYENMRIVLGSVKFPITAGDLADTAQLNWEDLLSLYKQNYNGANPINLQLDVGTDGLYTVPGLEATTPIKVVIDSFTFPFSAVDSKDAYMPTGTINLLETK